MDGISRRSKTNKFLMSFSLYPTYFDIKSEEETLKNVDLLASLATSFAKKDLPVPGGPYNNMPRNGLRLPENSRGNRKGRMTASLSKPLAVYNPATSEHLTFVL
eukprot:729068_1